VEVVSVVEDSPAARAGLRAEDLIVSVDGEPTPGVDSLQRLMVEELIGRPVKAQVVREGRMLELRLVPEEMGQVRGDTSRVPPGYGPRGGDTAPSSPG
jgi:S1-C subfamily serine protease